CHGWARYPTDAVRGAQHSGIDTTDQSISHGWARYPTDAVHGVRHSESKEVINELSLVSEVPERRGALCPAHRYCKLLIFKLYYFYVTL
ncbi:hypothetical protein, partial [Vibrio crassostreae]|uniref:hypothetical protein n=1 Tax=Vibrio crassostreae TaxID=246167 RepID=UPI001B3030AD